MEENQPQQRPIEEGSNLKIWIIFFAVITIIVIIFIIAAKAPNKQAKGNGLENGTAIIDVRDFVTNQRLDGITLSSTSQIESFQRTTSSSYANEIELKKVTYRLTAYGNDYFEGGTCLLINNTLPLYNQPCKTDRNCEDNYFCEGYSLNYYKQFTNKANTSYKTIRNETLGRCKMDLKMSCDSLCGDKCTILLKKKAVVTLDWQTASSNLSILWLRKGSNEFFQFPLDICVSYDNYLFKSVKLNLEKKPFVLSPDYDKCYTAMNDSEIRVETQGTGEIKFLVQGRWTAFNNTI